MQKEQKAVVLGAYGLIGAACVRALKARGFRVTGVGRSIIQGRASDPSIGWLARDIAETSSAVWARDFADADAVINAAGALQDGARDSLAGIHEFAVVEMIKALGGTRTRFIQISAAGAAVTATTAFLRSKAKGDQAIASSDLDWVILRPTLVFGPQAYGGTALLRAAAALPIINPEISPTTPVQTVCLEDVATAVAQAAEGGIPSRTIADLTEPEQRPLRELTAAVRRWLGFPPHRWSATVPRPITAMVCLWGDLLGWLGWRPPLRTTTLRVLDDGIIGDPSSWIAAGGRPCRSFEETLASIPATVQERWYARVYLLMPVMVAVLALFWLVSGIIGLSYRHAAEGILLDGAFSQWTATALVVSGSLVDILLGIAVLVRRWARAACIGMVAVSAAYLVGGSVWFPELWSDPLGPMVKILPGIVLALCLCAILTDR